MTSSKRENLRLAILTREDYRSPRILAESLKLQLEQAGVEVKMFYDLDFLNRLVGYKQSKISFHFWLVKKISNYFTDQKTISELKTFDAVVISECSPNGFWKRLYNVERFKTIVKKPVLFYEVYYLGNAPTQIKKLQNTGDALLNRYDFHLAVSAVTEIRGIPGKRWSCIGLDLSHTGLEPSAKNDFIAIVDFRQPGYEHIQAEQIQMLELLKIKTIVLEKNYSLKEIRDLYKKASVFFVQFPEAFGLPIAECLACGVQIFTPDSGWPMSWRLDDNPAVHGEGKLPDVFTTYNSKEDLKSKLARVKNEYDCNETPFKIFNSFLINYPHFYYGNLIELKAVLKKIEERDFD